MSRIFFAGWVSVAAEHKTWFMCSAATPMYDFGAFGDSIPSAVLNCGKFIGILGAYTHSSQPRYIWLLPIQKIHSLGEQKVLLTHTL